MRRLAAGIYESDDGRTMHLDVTEMLKDAGYPDTPANRATLEAAAHDAFSRLGIPVESTEEPWTTDDA